ncbi:putative Tripartite ATP-independent periplasmic transporter DctQ component [uncultured Desulfobacterium sp.]|uniref:Putative Tripartite ATP-independent periplasmic transporter DctQ component n=1 Tax=uncultured Desulfobacterium sp. TaxID=201089 RepID=A0A445N2I7_9BACT|nr:putative Tripartite ATP-independent periplasmic transporter DctQ component [uncultured Desulfobacterium sp.]
MTFLKRLDKLLARIEGWLIALFFGLMVVFTFIQVCLRGLYTHGHIQWANSVMGMLDWSEPFTRLLVLWLTFLGASLVTGENRHIKIDLISAVLPAKWLPLLELIMAIACVIISAIMLKVSMSYVRMDMSYGGTMFDNIPAWPFETIIPFGFSLIMFRFFIRAVDQGTEFFTGMKK